MGRWLKYAAFLLLVYVLLRSPNIIMLLDGSFHLLSVKLFKEWVTSFPPLPAKLVTMYMVITTLALGVFISADDKRLREFITPLLKIFKGDRPGPVRFIIIALFPVLVGLYSYSWVKPSFQAPPEPRQVHPEPPAQFDFKGESVNPQGLENPQRVGDATALAANIEHGKQVYYQNCFFCHGDNLDGKGFFAHGFNPLPANFTDPGTIAMLQESFVFWRISTGGPGLPGASTPWNSAMPVWQNILPKTDIWDAILYMYAGTDHQPRRFEGQAAAMSPAPAGAPPSGSSTAAPPASPLSPDQAAGKAVYEKKCAQCHGDFGNGQGYAAERVFPKPRDFTQGTFKLRTTSVSSLPTDDDVFRSISNGMPGSVMPAWGDVISESDRRHLVAYIKTFHQDGQLSRFQQEKPEAPIVIGKPPKVDAALVDAGRKLFVDNGCVECHGRQGRGDGTSAFTLHDDWNNRTFPANLRQSWNFRGGPTIEDIYRTLSTGLAGAPMPSFLDSIPKEEDRWALAAYVQSLSPPHGDTTDVTLHAKQISGPLPRNPDDSQWKDAPENAFPLVGQIILEPREFTPSMSEVRVRALYNAEDIAFLVTWDDRSESSPGKVINWEDGPKPVTDVDQLAIQFPEKQPATAEKPYFLNGDANNPVHLWHWQAGRDAVAVEEATGPAALAPADRALQTVTGKASFADGQWRLIVGRKLATGGKEIQFKPGQFIPIAFNAWDGTNGEAGARKAISAWYYVLLEPPTPKTMFVWPVLWGLVGLAFIFWASKRLHAVAARMSDSSSDS